MYELLVFLFDICINKKILMVVSVVKIASLNLCWPLNSGGVSHLFIKIKSSSTF